MKNLLRKKKYLPFLLKKPYVLIRLIINHYKKIILKKNLLRKAEYVVTFDCQCICRQCSSEFMKKNQRKLNFEEIKNLSRQIIKLGALQLNFTGGEPLLDKNLFDIIELFDTRKYLVTLSTNGMLLNKENIDKLKKTGVDIIKISLDSPYEDEHDLSRSAKGSYKRILNALEIIKNTKGIVGHLSLVATKIILNSSRIYDVLSLAKKFNVTVGLTVPSLAGRWSNHEEILLDEKEKEALNKISNHPLVMRDTHAGYFGKSYCPAGHEQIYISCYGDIIPCPLIQISFGNIREKSLYEIHKEIIFSEVFKEKKDICLSGEDREFIKKYILPIRNCRDLPIYHLEHPSAKCKKLISHFRNNENSFC